MSNSSTADPIDVLFLINGLGQSGGAEMSLLELLPGYVERGVRPTIAVLKSRPEGEREAERRGAEVVRLSGEGWRTWASAFRRLVGERRPDLIYTSLFEADLIGRFGRIGRSVPVLGSLVNTYDDPTGLEQRAEPSLKRRLAEQVDKYSGRVWTNHYHAVAEAVRDSYVRGYGVRPDKITVVHRGRARGRLGEPSPDRRAEIRQRLEVPEGAPMLVNVGRHETQKDQKTFVEAVGIVRESFPDVRAFVLGREGTTTPLLRDKIETLGLSEHVQLLGYRDDVPDVVSAADVFVFPSLREGAAGSVLEAMALARPVVASDIPALRDIVGGDVGILAPPCDAAAFARAVVDLLSNPERASRFGRTARRRFEDIHSLDHVADRMVALFRSVAAGDGGLPDLDASPTTSGAVE